ncbi:MAG: YHS domain-containing (seleno)protein [Chitinophagaceae bacterium]
MKKSLLLSWLLIAGFTTSFAQQSAVFSSAAEGAIHGYDPVAYFKESKAVKGDKKYSFTWNTATWYFANPENLEAFKATPEKFAPQYGGYCAYGLADGHKAPTDPEAWLIADGKLYLNYNKNVQAMWKKKQSAYIETADKNWPTLKDKD